MDLRPLFRRLSGFSLFGDLKGSRDFKRFAAVHISFLFFTTLSSVFINTFFMKNTGDMRASILFNLFNILTAMVFMNIAAPICSKTSPRTVVILGVIAYNLEYAFVLFMGDASSNYVILVGLLNGLGGVFYWLGYYNLLTDTTKDANRDQALSVFGIVLAVINLVVPMTSGFLISSLPGNVGYFVIFGISFGVSILTMVCTFFVKAPPSRNKSFHYLTAIKLVAREKRLSLPIAVKFCRGLREGIFTYIIPVFLFYMQPSEALVGFSTFLTGVGSVVAFVVIGRFMHPQNRIRLLVLATTIMVGFSVILLLATNLYVVLAYNLINAFLVQFMITPTTSIFIASVEQVPEAYDKRQEIFAIKDIILNGGRAIGILISLMLPVDLTLYAAAVLAMTAAQYGTAFLGHVAVKMLRKPKEETA